MEPCTTPDQADYPADCERQAADPNWEFCETDDSQFPAFRPDGIQIKNGVASLTGAPGLGVTLDESKLEKPSMIFD